MALIHSQRLERWLGKDQVEKLSTKMNGWYGPPIPVANVPGESIYAHGDGGFSGKINGGIIGNLTDYVSDAFKKIKRGIRRSVSSNLPSNKVFQLNAGFSSLSDLISEATAGGKRQSFIFAKTGVTGVANVANSLWDVGAFPQAGSTSAAPAGSSPDNTTTGGLLQSDPTGGDTLHFISATIFASVASQTLLMYDRFFQVNHTMTVDPRTVTGVPTRYQDTTSKGTFITQFVTTVLPAATPTYTITYVDQDGNTAETAAANTIVSGSIARRFPYAATVGNGWHIPLNSGDLGVRSITNLNLSAAMASGATDVVLGKPYVLIPLHAVNVPVIIDGINTAFNLTKITDGSCLSFMELWKSATTATAYNGRITLISG